MMQVLGIWGILAAVVNAAGFGVPVVSGNSICMDLQGIADGACTTGDPMIMLRSS